MKFKVGTSSPDSRKNSCDVIVLLGKKKQTTSTTLFDKASGRAITRAVSRGDLTSDTGSSVVLHDVPGTDAVRLLVVGVGDQAQLDKVAYKKLCTTVAEAVQSTGATDAVLHFVEELSVIDESLEWQCQQLSSAFCVSQYRFTAHKQRDQPKLPTLKTCHLIVPKQSLTAVKRAVKTGAAVANGMAMARDLGNLAGNICTPKYLAKQARTLARAHSSLTTKVLGEAQMRTLGMGAFLSVSQGSRQEAQLICMEYKGGPAKQRPVVLLGKGVTFDTGGISIKPSATMDEMKFDMCGAASVFGVMQAICAIAPKCNVVGVVAAAENMPDGDASRPGDVVTSMSGQSIEILNTDAEGRLVLCDSLTYVERYKPAAVIDIATLTGACVVALGKVTAAVMANDDKLAAELIDSSRRSQDLIWQLPLWSEYQTQLDSNFADMANIGGTTAGAITAGCFLSRFAEKYKWAHLDIAGVAWHSGANKGATGRPVPLLVQYILDHHALGQRT